MTFRIFLCILFGVFLPVFVASGQPADTTRYSLPDLLKMAMENNTSVQQASLETKRMKYMIQEARSTGLPHLSASGQFENYLELPTTLLPGEIIGQPGTMIPVKFGTTYNATGSVDLNQLLYNQTFFVALKVAGKSSEITSLNLLKTKEDVLFQLASMYYLTIATGKQTQNLQDNLNQTMMIRDIVALQYEKGFIKKVDLDRIDVTITNLRTQIINLENLYEKQLDMLKYMAGLEVSLPIKIQDENTPLPVTASVVMMHPENRSDFQMLLKNKELSELQLKLDYSGYFPTLTAFGRYSAQSQMNEFDFFSKDASWFRMGVIGLNLSIPIFDGLEKHAKSRQSKITIRQNELAIANTRALLTLEYQDALKKYLTNQQVLKDQQQNTQLAEDVFRITQEQFTQGVVSLTDFLSAQTSLRDAQTATVQASIQLDLAELNLLQANGQLFQLIK